MGNALEYLPSSTKRANEVKEMMDAEIQLFAPFDVAHAKAKSPCKRLWSETGTLTFEHYLR